MALFMFPSLPLVLMCDSTLKGDTRSAWCPWSSDSNPAVPANGWGLPARRFEFER